MAVRTIDELKSFFLKYWGTESAEVNLRNREQWIEDLFDTLGGGAARGFGGQFETIFEGTIQTDNDAPYNTFWFPSTPVWIIPEEGIFRFRVGNSNIGATGGTFSPLIVAIDLIELPPFDVNSEPPDSYYIQLVSNAFIWRHPQVSSSVVYCEVLGAKDIDNQLLLWDWRRPTELYEEYASCFL